MKKALLVEAVVNTVSGLLTCVWPSVMLDGFLRLDQLTSGEIRICYEMSRWFGALVLAQAVLLVIGAVRPNAELQKAIYWSLLSGEIFYLPAYIYFVRQFGNWTLSSLGTTVVLILLIFWRLDCLFREPHRFGARSSKTE